MAKALLALALSTVVAFSGKAQLVVLQEVFPAQRARQPIEMVPLPGSATKVCVGLQNGFIRVHDLASPTSRTDTMLDLRGKTVSSGEMGFLGFAFHPRYPAQPYLYVNYSANLPGQVHHNEIVRYRVVAGRADTAQKLRLLQYNQPYTNHNGGKLQFGSDGYLYIATGDGGSGGDPQGNGQKKTTLLGKILRIDVDRQDAGLNYAIPPTNPFADSLSTTIRKEIYAYGLRNPWKISLDSISGRGWIADVGQNLIEEVDTLVLGGNYGWRYREGRNCYDTPALCATPGLIDPVVQYSHGADGVSITGGSVYWGQALPMLRGKYIYGDFSSGRIWAVGLQGGVSSNMRICLSGINIGSFGTDQQGEHYVLDYNTGGILRFALDPTAAKTLAAPMGLRAFPNPAQREFIARYSLQSAGNVSLSLHNLEGKRVRNYGPHRQEAGAHSQTIDLKGLAAGAYLLELSHGTVRETLKVVVQ